MNRCEKGKNHRNELKVRVIEIVNDERKRNVLRRNNNEKGWSEDEQ